MHRGEGRLRGGSCLGFLLAVAARGMQSRALDGDAVRHLCFCGRALGLRSVGRSFVSLFVVDQSSWDAAAAEEDEGQRGRYKTVTREGGGEEGWVSAEGAQQREEDEVAGSRRRRRLKRRMTTPTMATHRFQCLDGKAQLLEFCSGRRCNGTSKTPNSNSNSNPNRKRTVTRECTRLYHRCSTVSRTATEGDSCCCNR